MGASMKGMRARNEGQSWVTGALLALSGLATILESGAALRVILKGEKPYVPS